jgi:hypothetical protein
LWTGIVSAYLHGVFGTRSDAHPASRAESIVDLVFFIRAGDDSSGGAYLCA